MYDVINVSRTKRNCKNVLFLFVFMCHKQEQIIQVTCAMLNGDKRFGFSVIGGREEGFPPCIDEITPGKNATESEIFHCLGSFIVFRL